MNIAINSFRNTPVQAFNPAGGLGFQGVANPIGQLFDLGYLFQLMQMMQSLQAGWGSFGGMTQGPQMSAPVQSPVAPMRAPSVAAAPARRNSPASSVASSVNSDFDPVAFRVNSNQNTIDKAGNGWVKVLPEAHAHPLGLTMIRTDIPEGQRPVMETFDPSLSLENIHVYHDIDTKKPHLNANSRYTMKNYWEKARQPDGLDYSALASTGLGHSSEFDYTPSEIRRIAIDATASEIFPGDYLSKNYNGPRKNKHEANLRRAYNRLNFFASKHEMDQGPEFMQNRHEGAKFAFAAANYKEHGGKFNDEALDNFLSGQLGVDEINSEVADGPRGLQLAKLSEITKGISDGKVEIEDVVAAGVVPKDEAKKFETSLKAIEHGEIRADISKINKDSTDADMKKVIVDSTKTRQADKKNRTQLNLKKRADAKAAKK